MLTFEKIEYKRNKHDDEVFGGKIVNPALWFKVRKILYAWERLLIDDFSRFDNFWAEKIVCGSRGNFWVIKKGKISTPIGFVYLYNIISGKPHMRANYEKNYSACVSVGFDKKYWGKIPYICGKEFLRFFFLELGFQKLKCEVYSKNPYVEGLLKKLGFVYEATLKAETIVNREPTDVKIWAIHINDYRKVAENYTFEEGERIEKLLEKRSILRKCCDYLKNRVF